LAASQIEMLSQDGTGTVTITPPATNTNRAITLPDAAGQVVLNSATQTLTNKTIQSSTIQSSTIQSSTIQGGALTLVASVATTSGTAFDFENIPSWVKRITVLFNGVSLSGTDQLLVRIGTASGVEETGYASASSASGGGNSSTTGFIIRTNTNANLSSGTMIITLFGGEVWVSSHNVYRTSDVADPVAGAGVKTLGGTLDRVRLTRTGTNTFDAGAVSVMYEG